jgi:HEAT repeat protein
MRPIFVLLAVLGLTVPLSAQTFLSRTAEDWQRDLGDREHASRRRSAAFALGKIGRGSESILSGLSAALQDADAGVRDAAAFALGEIAAEGNAGTVWARAGGELRNRLHDISPSVRRSVAFALGHCGAVARDAQAELRQALRDEQAVVRRNAAWALGQIGKDTHDEANADSLVAILERAERDPLVLRDAAGALGEICAGLKQARKPTPTAAARPLAAVFRNSTNPAVRRTALNALVSLVQPSLAQSAPGSNTILVQALTDALRKGTSDEKGLVAGALASLGEHAAPALKDLAALVDDDTAPTESRRNAALALTRAPESLLALPPTESRGVIKKLARALEPSQPTEVRQFTAEALARFGFPTIQPALPAVLNAIDRDTDPVVRQRCIWAFLNVDELRSLDEVVATLTRALSSSNRLIAYDAARCLARGLGANSPVAVINTLERMLNDDSIKVYNQTDAEVKGRSESSSGQSNVRPNVSGDARFMAAQGLSFIGRPASRPSIIKTLKELASSQDPRNQRSAREALDKLRE